MNPVCEIRPSRRISDHDPCLFYEWLVTNGLGGYTCGTLGNVPMRAYHGLLIAALPAPWGRMLMFPHLADEVLLPDGRAIRLDGRDDADGTLDFFGAPYFTDFRLELGLPVWRYDVCGIGIEKRIAMPHGQNTVLVTYGLVESNRSVEIRLHPALHARSHHAPVDTPPPEAYSLRTRDDYLEYRTDGATPALRIKLIGEHAKFMAQPRIEHNWLFRFERQRGYAHRGSVFLPGHFQARLDPFRPACLLASTEVNEAPECLDPQAIVRAENARRQQLVSRASLEASDHFGMQLVLAADQFVIHEPTMEQGSLTNEPFGTERKIIAGYPWFTDWGRDTLISLEGLLLTTGRYDEAKCVLRSLAHKGRGGRLPNVTHDGADDSQFHSADTTLWLFHAVDRYAEITGDHELSKELLSFLYDAIEQHLNCSHGDINVDPADGLLRQGTDEHPFTWMDAKVDGWIVTPRRGKPVEINALWYNALRLLEHWLEIAGELSRSRSVRNHADAAFVSFNRRFWFANGEYLFDVIDGELGDDAACRPNQLLAMSLKHPILSRERWLPVVTAVQNHLLTPVGLRTLAPWHHDYRSCYDGDVRSRDAAYHQGTVWPWLLGPFIDAWLRVHPADLETARSFLTGLSDHLAQACIGSISEIFDGDAPHRPNGCIAQAWSVAEVLRCWVKTQGRLTKCEPPPGAAAPNG